MNAVIFINKYDYLQLFFFFFQGYVSEVERIVQITIFSELDSINASFFQLVIGNQFVFFHAKDIDQNPRILPRQTIFEDSQ